METKALLTHIKPEWHNAFSQFVETGEASDDFLVYLEQDANAQQAVEKAFKAQATAFENLADELSDQSTLTTRAAHLDWACAT